MIKSYFFKTIIIIITVAVSGCIKEKTEKAEFPEWYLKIPEYPNALVAVGSGDGRAEALCMALSELSSQVQIQFSSQVEPSVKMKNKTVSGTHFGKVSVESVVSSFYVYDGSEKHISFVSTVTFDNEGNTFKISASFEETTNNGVATYRTNVSVTSENSDLGDVIGELKQSGIDIETYWGKDANYVKLMVDKDKLNSNIP